MVREIITVQVGQGGNQIGTTFWTALGEEHQLDKKGKFKSKSIQLDNVLLENINVYYEENNASYYQPRACLVDVEPGLMDVIKSSSIGSQFNPDSFIFGASRSMNTNKIRVVQNEGAELQDEVIDTIRRQGEKCDSLQGFQLLHSCGGVTGSFLGTLLLTKIRDNYILDTITTWSIFPSRKVSDVITEPYNATFSIDQMVEYSDYTYVLDNEALYNMALRLSKEPKYADLNYLASHAMMGATSSLRYKCELNQTLLKLGINLVVFPRLHFLLIGHSPFFAKGNGQNINLTAPELTHQMWSCKNFLCNLYPCEGKYLSTTCVYRGDIGRVLNYKTLIESYVNYINYKYLKDQIIPISVIDLCKHFFSEYTKYDQPSFVEWIPQNNKSAIIKIAPINTKLSATLIANTTSIKRVFQRISNQFTTMFKRRSYLHWYVSEGIDQMEFIGADMNIRRLITEYQDKQDAVVDMTSRNNDNNDNNDDFDDDNDVDTDF